MQTFDKIKEAIQGKNMEIKTYKCELIKNHFNNNIFDRTTNQTIQAKNKSIYLGKH